MRACVASAGDIVGRIRKRFARSVGRLLVPGAGLADCILRGIVPGNTRFAVYVNPLAVYVARRPPGIAIFFERDEEVVSDSIASFPSTYKVIS